MFKQSKSKNKNKKGLEVLNITKQFRFSFAHKLPNHPGACNNLHGHSGKLEVTVYAVGGPSPLTGMIMDFSELEAIVKDNVIDLLDHKYLNDILFNPTVEALVIWVISQLEKELPPHIRIRRIRFWEEIDSACAEWEESK